MEETVENLAEARVWMACLGHSKESDPPGVVLLTIFNKVNSFLKVEIFCYEILQSCLYHQYHLP